MEDQKITKVLKNSHQNNSEPVTNKNDREIPKERYIYLQQKYRILLIILVSI